MTDVQVSGIDPGQRRLNDPQTTGREYRNLSQPTHTMAHDDDVTVPMRDGVMLLADVDRPAEPGRYPVLLPAGESLNSAHTFRHSMFGLAQPTGQIHGSREPEIVKRLPPSLSFPSQKPLRGTVSADLVGNESSPFRVQAVAWIGGGWKVAEVDLTNEWVRFERR